MPPPIPGCSNHPLTQILPGIEGSRVTTTDYNGPRRQICWSVPWTQPKIRSLRQQRVTMEGEITQPPPCLSLPSMS